MTNCNFIVPPKSKDSQKSRKNLADQERMGSIMTDHTRFGDQKMAKDRYKNHYFLVK